jgi:ABC-type nitrate/sulfonate/bicarbonate transport system ATPase subunit
VVSSVPGGAAAVFIRDVSKAHRSTDGAAVLVLDRLSLTIGAGEMVSLLGPNGCGKSTLLRMIAGLDHPTSGELLLGDEPIIGPSARCGLMFQDPNLYPWLSIRRNIQAGLLARGVLNQHRHEVEEFLQLVGLEAFAGAYPHQLSGGMAQRAALARALINRPGVLLLDEPLGALDQFTRMRMQDEVLRLWQARGTTMVLVTHDIDEAIYMSDRIVMLGARPGRVERVLDVSLSRPRQRIGAEYVELRSTILEMLHFAGAAGEGVP